MTKEQVIDHAQACANLYKEPYLVYTMDGDEGWGTTSLEFNKIMRDWGRTSHSPDDQGSLVLYPQV